MVIMSIAVYWRMLMIERKVLGSRLMKFMNIRHDAHRLRDNQRHQEINQILADIGFHGFKFK